MKRMLILILSGCFLTGLLFVGTSCNDKNLTGLRGGVYNTWRVTLVQETPYPYVETVRIKCTEDECTHIYADGSPSSSYYRLPYTLDGYTFTMVGDDGRVFTGTFSDDNHGSGTWESLAYGSSWSGTWSAVRIPNF